MSSYQYIQAFVRAVETRNSKKLRQLLSINPGANKGAEIALFSDPSDVDLYLVPEKFQPVVGGYFKVMRAVYGASDIDATFTELLALVMHLNRAAESHTNWICPVMIGCSNELISVHQVRAKQKRRRSGDNPAAEDGTSETDALEQVASTINRAFKICLTDKNPDMAELKKASIHFFLALLIKIYFKLNRLELAKSMEKALIGTGLAIPTIVNSPVQYRKHVITYLYYSSLLSLNDADYSLAEAKLLTALEFLLCYELPEKVELQTEKLLMLVLPLKLYNHSETLPDAVWRRFPRLAFLYRDNLFGAVRSGNLAQYAACVDRFRAVLLKRHLYLLVVQMKRLCLRNLFRRSCAIYAELAERGHIVPLEVLRTAMEYSGGGSVCVEEVECALANLVAAKQVKGYISHGNGCIVLLKTDPFPRVK